MSPWSTHPSPSHTSLVFDSTKGYPGEGPLIDPMEPHDLTVLAELLDLYEDGHKVIWPQGIRGPTQAIQVLEAAAESDEQAPLQTLVVQPLYQ